MMDNWPTLRVGPAAEVGGVRKIALLRALHLGDFLCAVPAFRALRERFPGAEITVIGLPWSHSLVGRYPYLDRFLEFPGYQGLEEVTWDRDKSLRFLVEARRYQYDLAIQMHGDGRLSNGFVAQLGARVTLGYRSGDPSRRRELDLELKWDRTEHEVHRWLRLVNLLGAMGTPKLEFPLLQADWLELERVAGGAGIDLAKPVIGLHPGGKDPAKRWPAERFAFVADLLAERLGAQVIITGGHEELAAAERVAAEMRGGRAYVLAGETSLGGLAALLSQMQLLVTNDTGPSHIAAALGTPSVVLFGPTDPRRWAPLDTDRHRTIWSGRGNPISQIPVERVVEESLALVERWAYQTY